MGGHELVDDEWRRWMAENLMLGNSPESIAARLTDAGVGQAAAQALVEEAARHPFVIAGRQLGGQLAKREWLLDTLAGAARTSGSWGTVDRRHRLGGDEFFERYYATGRPVLVTGWLDGWPALERWTMEYLGSRVGDRMVEAQGNRTANPLYEVNRSQHRTLIRFSEFLQRVTEGPANDWYITANNSEVNRTTLADLFDEVGTLDEYLDVEGSGRQGFLWIGAEGTVTPLHHDLTNNLFAQVRGRKLVKMVSALDTAKVYPRVHVYSDVPDPEHPDLTRFPRFADATVATVMVQPGELLFLPVGWWHYVEALDDSVTITYTNFRRDNSAGTTFPG